MNVFPKPLDTRITTAVKDIIGPGRSVDSLIALTVTSVFSEKASSPLYPLFEYAVNNFSNSAVEKYLEIPIVSSNDQEETWVSIMRKCLSSDIINLLNVFGNESKYEIIKQEIKRIINGE